MLRRTIPTGHQVVPGSLAFEPAGNRCWAATAAGDLVTVRLLDAVVGVPGQGYLDPVAVLPQADGLTVAVVEADGTVLTALRTDADRARARLVTQLPDGALAAAAGPEPGSILVLTGTTGGGAPRLRTCRLDTGAVQDVSADLDGAHALAVDGPAFVFCAQADGTDTMVAVDLTDGTSAAVPGPSSVDCATTSPAGPGVLVSAAGRLALLDPAGTEVLAEDLGTPVQGLARWGSLVLAAAGTDLVTVEWAVDEGPVGLTVPLGPLYVNGWARLPLDLTPLGLTPGDVVATVREGIDGGSLSAGIETPAPDSLMLLAGVRTGEFHLDLTLAADGSALATRRFRVTDLWPDEEVGPPVAITGDHGNYLMSWGGTGGVAGYLKPAPNRWGVLTVLVELRDRGWDGLEVPARTEWKDRVIGGGESVRRFYQEASAFQDGVHGTTVDLVGGQVFGPVPVDAGWGDVFKVRKPGDVNGGWLTKSTAFTALSGAISDFFADLPGGGLLLAAADTVSVVVRSGTDEPVDMGPNTDPLPTRYVWGHASPNPVDFYRKDATTYTQFARRVTVMTDRDPAGAEVHNHTYTLCHELGHSLGLADLYDANGKFPAEINERRPAGVDLMSTSEDLPHFSIANKIRLGWADRGWLRRFDFSTSPVGGTVVLQATETLTGTGPTAGRFAGIEVPIMDDWSYLFEYRREQKDDLGDQRLDQTVVPGRTEILVGTDLRVRGGGGVARPPILLLPKDADGDGPTLVDAGQDYEDSDTTNPARMHDFRLRLTGVATPDPDSATVAVDYLEAHRPQLHIQPAPGDGNFRSDDITLRGPFGPMTGPVKGMPNTVQITVHNLGSLEARDTRIHVRWLPFTVTAGDWRPLADPAPFDVPANGFTTLVVPWELPASVKIAEAEAEHFCVRVDIDRYLDPAHPDHEEIVVSDNWAQSNFDAVSVGFGSPSDRVVTAVGAANVLDRATTYRFGVDQDSDFYRVYLGHAWLRLPAGADAAVELAYESLSDDPVHGAEFDRRVETVTSRDAHVSLSSWILPEASECGAAQPVFGAGLALRAGRRTSISDVRRRGELLTGRVRASSNGVVFDLAFGEFHLAVWPDDDPSQVTHTVGEIVNGTGRVLLSGDTLRELADGRRFTYTLGRPQDTAFATAVTPPAPLE